MSGSLLTVTLIVAGMIVFWRLTLLVVVALVIAFLVVGITQVSEAFGAGPTPAQTAVTPADGPH